MNKLKVNTGIAAVLVFASIFAGWEVLLIVSALLLIFSEFNDKTKDVTVKVISFLAGISIITLGWGLIVNGIDLLFNVIEKFVDIINCYLSEPITMINLTKYVITPISKLVEIGDKIFDYIIIIIKFKFILDILNNKPRKNNIITKFVNKVINFINQCNGVNIATNVQVNQAPVQNIQANNQMMNQNVQMNNQMQNNQVNNPIQNTQIPNSNQFTNQQ